jgi:hypothetical protein
MSPSDLHLSPHKLREGSGIYLRLVLRAVKGFFAYSSEWHLLPVFLALYVLGWEALSIPAITNKRKRITSSLFSLWSVHFFFKFP